jgi:putative acetyltransferase
VVFVRPFKDEDASVLPEIFFSAVREVASAHYSREQIHAWAPEKPPAERFLQRAHDGRILVVAVDDGDVPVAYGDCERDGHIDHLFCHPDHCGTGVAARLYAKLEESARSAGIDRLYVEASEPARRFFERQGFVVDERNDFELAGVAIHNFRMSKKLG